VVPHPDDEVLSTGGLIALQRRRGVEVVVVAVTDGEAAYPSETPSALAERRRREQSCALEVLGVSPGAIVRCGLPDGRVPDHVNALSNRLLSVVRSDDLLVGPWTHDHHSDHVACGEAVVAVGRAAGITTIGSLFWAYHHTDPADVVPRSFMRLDLDDVLVRVRDEALLAHESQLPGGADDSVLSPALLSPLRQLCEMYVAVA
jgi:LmbE family N-acetylglucosaminyl deacetylase